MSRPESVFELLEPATEILSTTRVEFGRVPDRLKLQVQEIESRQEVDLSDVAARGKSQDVAAIGKNREISTDFTTFRRTYSNLTEPLSFATHIRNRAHALINLLPFPHLYQNVLSAIANVDWQREAASECLEDTLTYLAFAGISSNQTAIAYLDWLEPRLRRALDCYEQMVNCHKHERDEFVRNFDAGKF